MNENDERQYDDIIDLPHHVSSKRAPMPALARAAQFSPFAALTGYDDAITETGRYTEERRELSDDEKEKLDDRLRLLIESTGDYPEVHITYFRPDETKPGGSYERAVGRVRRVDEYYGNIVFTDGRRIPLADICDISGDIFAAAERTAE
ncbi:MAG: hypothetical protein ACI4XA_06945 [Oscillospiraceae bacterium]